MKFVIMPVKEYNKRAFCLYDEVWIEWEESEKNKEKPLLKDFLFLNEFGEMKEEGYVASSFGLKAFGMTRNEAIDCLSNEMKKKMEELH